MTELILALDTPDGAGALRLLDRLPLLRWVKIGSSLMTREGPDFVHQLTGRGLKVFLDLKWHDIPNTVAGSVEAALQLGVSMATVHTLGGAAMLEAAATAAGGDLALVGVTVLTSHDAAGYGVAVGRSGVDLMGEVERQALIALAAGLQGVVCSPQEVSFLRGVLGPGPTIVVPGIRRRADPTGDQTRVATARDAASRGATYLVVGRPILQAADPAAAFDEFMQEAQ